MFAVGTYFTKTNEGEAGNVCNLSFRNKPNRQTSMSDLSVRRFFYVRVSVAFQKERSELCSSE
jgi:hypothetical protein